MKVTGQVILATVVEPGHFEEVTFEQGLKDEKGQTTNQEVGENTRWAASIKALWQDLGFV